LTLTGSSGGYTSVAYSPDGKYLAAVGESRVITAWDVGAGEVVLTLPESPGLVHAVTYSADGKRLAAAGQGVTLWDAVTGLKMLSLEPKRFFNRVLFSPDGHRLVASGADGVQVWNARSLED